MKIEISINMVYGASLSTFNGQSAPIGGKMIIVTIDEIKNRIKTKYPNEPFEIIEYTRVTKPFTIKCLKCGKVVTYSSFNNFIRSSRKGICECYNEKSNTNRHLEALNKIKTILEHNNEIKFINFWYKEETKKNMVQVKCLKCNQNYSKPFAEFIKNESCPFCIGRELLNTKALQSILGSEYEILDQYKDENTKIHVKHKCGFVWTTKARKLYNYIGCPHCNKKRSKGEQKITAYLISHGIDFEIEKSFPWQSNLKRRYDFYLPDFNLICEYNGEQHYIDKSFFVTPLAEQQEIDKQKENEARANGYNYLIIPYFNFNQIETILDNWFNDYSARK